MRFTLNQLREIVMHQGMATRCKMIEIADEQRCIVHVPPVELSRVREVLERYRVMGVRYDYVPLESKEVKAFQFVWVKVDKTTVDVITL